MKLQVHSIHFDADNKLINFIQKKVDKLETFYDRLVDGEVFLRLNNEGVDNKTVEIKVKVPGSQLFATEKAKSFEEATDLATDALRMQLKKFKTKVKNGRVKRLNYIKMPAGYFCQRAFFILETWMRQYWE
jgi:putative sigma-54 modulation protein